MYKQVLGIIFLLTLVSCTKFSLKLESYEKQCFFEILSKFVTTQEPSKNTQSISILEVQACTNSKLAIWFKESGVQSFTSNQKANSNHSTYTSWLPLTRHIRSAFGTLTTKG